jgi:hypothetical protein
VSSKIGSGFWLDVIREMERVEIGSAHRSSARKGLIGPSALASIPLIISGL